MNRENYPPKGLVDENILSEQVVFIVGVCAENQCLMFFYFVQRKIICFLKKVKVDFVCDIYMTVE